MMGVLYLAWQYLRYYRWKTVVLVAAINLVIYLPAAVQVLINQTGEQLTARAEATPLLVGAKGSPLELALSSLYFQSDTPATLNYANVKTIRTTGLAQAIPLYVRFHARGFPIVGTSLSYFDFRELNIARGRSMAMLGEAVIGSVVAERLGITVGDNLVSSPESVFDLAGVYPLKMKVVGILASSYSPDDEAVFVDLKTSWIIQGLGHGHQDLVKPQAVRQVLKRDGDNIVANASVVNYNEITADNIDSFHFHGSSDELPISAIIADPLDQKSGVLLLGRFESGEFNSQIVRPSVLIKDLLETIFTVQQYVIIAMLLIGVATVMVVILVFVLSLRLRRDEISTMANIGGGKLHIAALMATEILLVLLISAAIAAVLTWLTQQFGVVFLRTLIVG
jgi:putative ABC transport system permease protein